MGQLNISIATRRDDATLKKIFETPGAPTKESIGNKIVNFVTSVFSGTELGPTGAAPTIAISIEGQATAASGTLTVSSTGSTAAQTCSIAGVTFTAVASGATGNQFNVSTTPATQAANMVTAINASSSLTGIVTAASVLGVVTITAVTKGKMGNGIAISAGNLANVAASGALLTGGAADATATTLSF
jgi:phage tail sheath gpL-like